MAARLKALMPNVDQIVFHANGGTVSMAVESTPIMLGNSGQDNKLIVGDDPRVQTSLVLLMEHVTGWSFRIERNDESVTIYRRWKPL